MYQINLSLNNYHFIIAVVEQNPIVLLPNYL